MTYFEPLSIQDRSFLALEDANSSAHMHVGGVSVYEGGGLATPAGAVDAERIRSYVESRLPLIPRYRQRLAYTPIEGHPVWVDDDRFNVRYHVRHTRLPRPGDERELKRLTGRIMSQRLNRSRPLWEFWIIEGLSDGRFAALTKTHHCMIDGVSGVDLSTVLMRVEPDNAFDPPSPWEPRPAPGGFELLGLDVRQRLGTPARIVGSALESVRADDWSLDRLWQGAGSVARAAKLAWQGPADTPINRDIGPHRRFDWTSVDLEEVKAVKNRLGGTVNDVLLTVVAGALGEFLRRRRVNVDIMDFIAAVPVNVRAAGDRSLGNQVSAWLARLPIAEREPRRRFEAVRRVTTELKQSGGTNPASYMYTLADWGGPVALSLAVQLTRHLSPCNLVVTNVPGPPFPLYVLGAKMLAAYPMVTLLEGQGLGIAAFSYCGRLYFGFNADWDMLPDLHDLVLAVERGMRDLHAATEAPGQRS